MLNDCSKPSLWDLRDVGLKLKWILGSHLKTKLSKNRNSCLGGRAGGLPALIRICTGPSMGGRKCMMTGMWRSQICVHKCAITHAHTRAWAMSGNSRAVGAEWAPTRRSAGGPGTRTRDWQGWVIFSLWVGSCWQAWLSALGPLLESWAVTEPWELMAPRERGPDASKGCRLLETPGGSPCRGWAVLPPEVRRLPAASWRQPATGKERATVATRSGSRLSGSLLWLQTSSSVKWLKSNFLACSSGLPGGTKKRKTFESVLKTVFKKWIKPLHVFLCVYFYPLHLKVCKAGGTRHSFWVFGVSALVPCTGNSNRWVPAKSQMSATLEHR